MFKFQQFIGKYLFIIITLPVHIESIVPHWKTNSNASQFVHLENLIGSIHRYAPDYVHIFVRDTGLSKSQRLLLKRYENVEIFRFTNITHRKAKRIDAENELIQIDGKYIVGNSNGKLLYVDSIRKQFYLAIVIPFIRSQLSNVILQLNLSKIYTPCEHQFNSVDLIFYHNEGLNSSLDKFIREIKYFHNCYREIHYLAINLTREENQYPLGSFIMWQKLLLDDNNKSFSLRTYGYTHFFLMEPDTRPIRQFWLDAIVHQITNGDFQKRYFTTNWWISGSVYRGSKAIGQRFLHINGNALYHLTTTFITHVKLFSDVYLTEEHSKTGYDLIMFSLLLHNQSLGKRLWHKFRFSDFIQNCWHTGCEGSDLLNNTLFILNNPDTYLIHGNYYNETIYQQNYSSKYVIFVLCVLLNVIILQQFRQCNRRTKFKKNFMFFCSWIRMLRIL